jgi:DNA-binding MarR family transcriptional regulator
VTISKANLNLPVLLRHARATYGSALRAALVDAGFDDVPLNGLYVFGTLDPSGTPTPMGDLVGGLALTKQAGGQMVEVMVLKGYLQRLPDPNDRRKLMVALSERGMAAARVQREARETLDAKLTEAIGVDGIQQMRHGLMTLIEIGQKSVAPAAEPAA